MQTYEDAVNEAVQLLVAHGEQRGPVTEYFYDRLHHDRELQQVLLGQALPDDPAEAAAVIRRRGIDVIHGLMNRAVKRLSHAHDAD